MFEQSMLNGTAKTRQVWTVMVSFLIQTVVIGVGVLIPLIAFDKLPQARLVAPLMAPPPPPPPGPTGSMKEHSVRVVDVKWQYQKGRLTEPGPVPVGVRTIVDPPDVAPDGASVCPYCVPGSVGPFNGRPGGVLNSIGVAPPQAEQRQTQVVNRAATKPAEKPPIRVVLGGVVVQAKLIHKVTPAYPLPARAMRISGTVRLQAVISRDGRIQSLALMSGHPLLVPAALAAVRQWVYSPTLLNGDPVEVLTTIDVIFTLSQ